MSCDEDRSMVPGDIKTAMAYAKGAIQTYELSDELSGIMMPIITDSYIDGVNEGFEEACKIIGSTEFYQYFNGVVDQENLVKLLREQRKKK